jgi:serine protease Do
MQTIVTRLAAVELFVLCGIAVAPAAAPAQVPLEPTEIAAQAQAATVQIRSLDRDGRRIGSGTGFVISADGMIVTNLHVVRRAHTLQIDLPTGEERRDVLFVAGDPGHDVAILKLSAEGHPWLPLREAPEAEVGQRIYTMGHPLGQTATFSDGLVSALRTVQDVDLIQITAPISAGSSGGPVMNEAGEVIGVATMMLRGGQNLNFAVPVRYVRPLLEQGTAPRPFAANLLPRERRGIALLGAPPAGRAPRPSAPAASGTHTAEAAEEIVVRQIARLEAALAAEGVARRSHPIETGALRNGQTDTISIELRSGTPYAMVGVCDMDCTDVDLQLFAPDGTLLDEDVRVSDIPSVRFTPPVEGSYQLRVTMSGCTSDPCRYGVASFVLR